MDVFPHKTPFWVKQLYPKRIWDMHGKENMQKTIYLSFDDGPIPKVTPWVLKTLKEFDAKASFFCIGENLQKHSEIAERALNEGHALGNHTFHHVNGWKTSLETYAEEVQQTADLFTQIELKTHLFRPPYGKINSKQADFILKKNYKIIMWDVLTKDYNQGLQAEDLLSKSIAATRNGSIVIFHDSEKAFENLTYILPKYLQHFSQLGFSFKKL